MVFLSKRRNNSRGSCNNVDINQKLASSGICNCQIKNNNNYTDASCNYFIYKIIILTFTAKFPRYPKYNLTPSRTEVVIKTANVMN